MTHPSSGYGDRAWTQAGRTRDLVLSTPGWHGRSTGDPRAASQAGLCVQGHRPSRIRRISLAPANSTETAVRPGIRTRSADVSGREGGDNREWGRRDDGTRSWKLQRWGAATSSLSLRQYARPGQLHHCVGHHADMSGAEVGRRHQPVFAARAIGQCACEERSNLGCSDAAALVCV